MTDSRFTVGQKVKAVAFTNFDGRPVAERGPLTVESVTLHESAPTSPQPMKPYYRVKAVESNGLGYVEGAERYFEAIP